MVKKTQAVVDFIKIPKDFKSLKDLGDLVGNYDIVSRLSNALNDYQKVYVESMMFDFYNINDYIPEKNHKLFMVEGENLTLREYHEHFSIQDRIFFTLVRCKKILFENISLQDYLDTKSILFKDNKKILDDIRLFVDLKEKKIYFAFWTVFPEKYSSPTKYKVDTKKNQLIATIEYEYTYSQRVGGVWISTFGGNGYYTGGKMIDVSATGYVYYIFCTKTNLFLKAITIEREHGSDNIEAKSRY